MRPTSLVRRCATPLLAAAIALLAPAASLALQQPQPTAQAPVAAVSEATALLPNGRQPIAGVLTGGQVPPESLAGLAAAGYEVLVNLRPAEEGAPAIAEAAKGLGMRYVELPVAGPQDLTAEKVAELGRLLAERGESPVVVYCASGNRAGALLALEQAQVEGKPPQQALEVGLAAGLTRLEPQVRELLGLPPG